MTKHQKIGPASAGAVEVKAAVDKLGQAFHEFKTTNDVADAEKRMRGHVDTVLEQKMDRINADLSRLQAGLDGLSIAGVRPGMGRGAVSGDVIEHKAGFYDQYMRKGNDHGLARLEAKALTTSVDAEGGFAVPEELDGTIEKLLRDISPIRRIANVVQIGTSNYKKLVATGGAASGWVGESATRSETTAPLFSEIAPPLGELYANPAATQSMLDDAFFNVEAWLAEELSNEFGQKEGAAFISGNGTDKPKGFLAYTTAATADSARGFGTLEHLATGVDGAWPAADPSDILVDLIYSLRPVYRGGASFVMNTNLVAEIRKFKDVDGNYLWRPGLAEGIPATLMGYPVVEAEDMPDKASASLSIAFGNFTRGYTITDRLGTRVLRDPYSNKPFVHFYTTKRTGGGVVNSEAIKLLKFSLT
jgi:HK97 family phage major capsid protein